MSEGLRDGEPCSHRGCLSHRTHPCEGCGRVAGKAPIKYPFHEPETDIQHRVLVSIPFDYNYSKNKIEGRTRSGKTYPLKEHWELREYLTRVLTEACAGIEWKKQKYYVSYYAQKPSNRGDVINFLEAFADVIKKVIGIDDNYLCVEDIDFEVLRNSKENKIFISISQ